jgi:hypothetical protein
MVSFLVDTATCSTLFERRGDNQIFGAKLIPVTKEKFGNEESNRIHKNRYSHIALTTMATACTAKCTEHKQNTNKLR